MSYSRYADDITLSGADGQRINDLIHAVKEIAEEEGYRLHTKKKLRIARRHDRQVVTGLVVNEKVALPRAKRRWLRAVEHRMKTKGNATLTEPQLAGWRALLNMIATQSSTSPEK